LPGYPSWFSIKQKIQWFSGMGVRKVRRKCVRGKVLLRNFIFVSFAIENNLKIFKSLIL